MGGRRRARGLLRDHPLSAKRARYALGSVGSGCCVCMQLTSEQVRVIDVARGRDDGRTGRTPDSGFVLAVSSFLRVRVTSSYLRSDGIGMPRGTRKQSLYVNESSSAGQSSSPTAPEFGNETRRALLRHTLAMRRRRGAVWLCALASSAAYTTRRLDAERLPHTATTLVAPKAPDEYDDIASAKKSRGL